MKKIIQWGIYITLSVIGILAFFVLAGDEDPINPIPIGQFIAVKAGAISVIGGCIWLGKKCDKKGLLPDIKDDDL